MARTSAHKPEWHFQVIALEHGSAKHQIAKSLGKVRDPAAVDAVCRLLASRSLLVRKYAAEALAEMGDQRAFESLARAIHDPVPKVRREVLRAIARIGHPQSLPLLITELRREAAGSR